MVLDRDVRCSLCWFWMAARITMLPEDMNSRIPRPKLTLVRKGGSFSQLYSTVLRIGSKARRSWNPSSRHQILKLQAVEHILKTWKIWSVSNLIKSQSSIQTHATCIILPLHQHHTVIHTPEPSKQLPLLPDYLMHPSSGPGTTP